MLSNAPANGAPGDVLALFGDRAKFVRVGRAKLPALRLRLCDGPCRRELEGLRASGDDDGRRARSAHRLHAELEAIRYACPSCARLHWVEIKLKSEDALYDMELRL